MLMPSPRRSVPSTVTSPMWMAQRSSSRTAASWTAAVRATVSCTISAVRVASTGLGELDQQAVAQRLEDAPAAGGDQRIDVAAQRRHAASTRSSSASTRAVRFGDVEGRAPRPAGGLPPLLVAARASRHLARALRGRLRAMPEIPEATMKSLTHSASLCRRVASSRRASAPRGSVANAARSCRNDTAVEDGLCLGALLGVVHGDAKVAIAVGRRCEVSHPRR